MYNVCYFLLLPVSACFTPRMATSQRTTCSKDNIPLLLIEEIPHQVSSPHSFQIFTGFKHILKGWSYFFYLQISTVSLAFPMETNNIQHPTSRPPLSSKHTAFQFPLHGIQCLPRSAWNPGAIPGLQHALPVMFGLLSGESVKGYVVMLMAYNLYNFSHTQNPVKKGTFSRN